MRIHLRSPHLPRSEEAVSGQAGPPTATASSSDPYVIDVDLAAQPDATVAHLKALITARLPFPLPASQQRLIFLGRFLRDEDNLSSLFGSAADATVHLLFPPECLPVAPPGLSGPSQVPSAPPAPTTSGPTRSSPASEDTPRTTPRQSGISLEGRPPADWEGMAHPGVTPSTYRALFYDPVEKKIQVGTDWEYHSGRPYLYTPPLLPVGQHVRRETTRRGEPTRRPSANMPGREPSAGLFLGMQFGDSNEALVAEEAHTAPTTADTGTLRQRAVPRENGSTQPGEATADSSRPASAGQVTATLAVDINVDTMLVSALTGFLSFMWLILRVALFIAFFGNSGGPYQRIGVYLVSGLFIMQRLGVFQGMSTSPQTRQYLRNAVGLTPSPTPPTQSAPLSSPVSTTPIGYLYRLATNVVRFVGLYIIALFPGVDLHAPNPSSAINPLLPTGTASATPPA